MGMSGKLQIGLVFCALIAISNSASHAGYMPGYIWNRQSVWYGGTGDGTINGNPNLDSMNNPTWEYTARGGGGIGSINPWYSSSPSILGSFATGGGNGWI